MYSVELLKDLSQRLLGNSNPFILHRDSGETDIPSDPNPNDLTLIRILRSIAEQVQRCLRDRIRIESHNQRLVGIASFHNKSHVPDMEHVRLNGVTHNFNHVRLFTVVLLAPSIHLRKVEHIVNQVSQTLTLLSDDAVELLSCRLIHHQPRLQRLAKHPNQGKRSLQLV